MRRKVRVAGLVGHDVSVEVGLFSGPELLVDGRPAPKGAKRNSRLLRLDDGTEILAEFGTLGRSALPLDSVPTLTIYGKTMQLWKPLTWYEALWSAIPMVQLFFGGCIGGAVGGAATFINTRVFRLGLSKVMKYVVTGLITVVSVALGVGLATLAGYAAALL
jgi:hypothetical protein